VFRMQCSRCNHRHRSCGIRGTSSDKLAVGAVEPASPVLFDLIPMGPYIELRLSSIIDTICPIMILSEAKIIGVR